MLLERIDKYLTETIGYAFYDELMEMVDNVETCHKELINCLEGAVDEETIDTQSYKSIERDIRQMQDIFKKVSTKIYKAIS